MTAKNVVGTGNFFFPPDRRRLWIGLTIAILGPILVTPLVRDGRPLAAVPGTAYLLAVVAATIFGRVAAAAVAIPLSVILLHSYADASIESVGSGADADLWVATAFVLVAAMIVLILTRRGVDVEAQVEEGSRLQLLARAGDALAESLEVGETLRRLGDVIVPALADWFAVELVEDGEIRSVIVMHPDPAKVELARELQQRFPTDPDAATGAPMIRTGVSELTETIPDEMLTALIEDHALLGTMRDLHLHCAMVVPLTARGHTIGAISLIGAESHERYTKGDLQLAEEIADRAALAIDTARLFAAETEARMRAVAETRRNQVLTNVTAAFGLASTLDEVITAMLEEGIRAAGAGAATVGIMESDGRVSVRGLLGYQPDDHRYWHEFSLDDEIPMADAIRDARPVVVSTTAERDRRYPSLAGREQRDHALVCVPLLLGTEVLGAFSASYPPETDFGEEDLALLGSIGEQCAQAIDRARSRERALVAVDRLDALAAASQALATSLELDGTIATVMRLATQHLGEDVSLVRFSDRGTEVLAEVGSRSAEARALVGEALDPARLFGLPYLRVPEDATGPDATIIFPLAIAGVVVEALIVAGPDLAPEDLGFSVEVVRRMARAIENAGLYQERDFVAKTLQEGLLPPTLPEVPGVEIAALFLPSERGRRICGDFYDVFETADGQWAAVVGDVCGKGVEAANLTGMARHTLRAVADTEQPSEALEVLNRAMLREPLDGRFLTAAMLYIEPNPEGARVTIASAGHPLPQLLDATGQTRRVGEHGTLLGVIPDVQIKNADVDLRSGQAIVVFTDGVIDKLEASGEEPQALLGTLRGRSFGSAAEIRDQIRAFIEGLGTERYDDVAVLVIRAR